METRRADHGCLSLPTCAVLESSSWGEWARSWEPLLEYLLCCARDPRRVFSSIYKATCALSPLSRCWMLRCFLSQKNTFVHNPSPGDDRSVCVPSFPQVPQLCSESVTLVVPMFVFSVIQLGSRGYNYRATETKASWPVSLQVTFLFFSHLR